MSKCLLSVKTKGKKGEHQSTFHMVRCTQCNMMLQYNIISTECLLLPSHYSENFKIILTSAISKYEYLFIQNNRFHSSDLCFGGIQFKFRPVDHICCLKVSIIFPLNRQANARIICKYGV
jgi:hypothetical protein